MRLWFFDQPFAATMSSVPVAETSMSSADSVALAG
jgi:hypothetical protein